MEEVNELQIQSFYKAIERAGSQIITPKPKPKIICTCNPANNWVKELFYDRYMNNTLPDDWLYIPSKIFDNPYIDDEYLNSLKSLPRYEYEVFVNGNWDIQQRSGAEFYKEFSLDKHVGETIYDHDQPIWLSIDENVNPYFPASVWQIHGRTAMCIDEFTMKNPKNTVEGLVNEFMFRYRNHKGGLIITGDRTSKKEDVKQEKGMDLFTVIAKQLSSFHPSIRLPSSNPSVWMRGLFINTILYSNYGGISILINPKCKATIADFVNVKEDPDPKKGKYKAEKATDPTSNVSYQKWGHLTDTADYFICQAFSADYIRYQNGSGAGSFIFGKDDFNESRRW